ncbi:hypothetical protein FISHEDRAFT_21247, partial [Fistulina hepatica ATCC 64428]
ARPDKYCHPPETESRVVMLLWRWKIWLEGTLIFGMLEPWEKVLISAFFGILLTLVFTATFKYLPRELIALHRRVVYYLYGE